MPILVRMYAAFDLGNGQGARHWNQLLVASRPTAELAEENKQLGQALARVLIHLGVGDAGAWHVDPCVTYEVMFALAPSPRHRHEDAEIIVVLRGSQTDQEGTIVAGELRVNRSNTSHGVRSDEGCIVLIVWERPVVFEG
jgi:hypothetical protein